jgi:hypothetical protein
MTIKLFGFLSFYYDEDIPGHRLTLDTNILWPWQENTISKSII